MPVWVVLGVGVAFYAWLLGYFLGQKLFLTGSDQFYYLALGDQLLLDGRLLDRTNDPALLPVTPQNGIVLVYGLLSALELPGLARLRFVTGVNWLAWLSTLLPLWWIARYLGVRDRLARALLLLGTLGGWQIVFYVMLPNTDALFHASSIWIAWGLLRLFHHPPGAGSDRTYPASYAGAGGGSALTGLAERYPPREGGWWWTFWLLLAASPVVVHLRVNLFILYIAAGLTLLLSRRPLRRKLADLAAVAAFAGAALVSLLVVYRFVETATDPGLYFDIAENVGRLGRALSALALVTLEGVPGHVFGVLALAALAGAMAWALSRRHEPMLFTLLVVAGSVSFVVLAHSQTHRYMLGAFPLILAAALAFRWSRPLAYLLIGLVLVRSVYITAKPYPPLDSRDFTRYLAESDYRLPDDAVLASQLERKTYVLVHGRHQRDLCAGIEPDTRRVWVAGDSAWQADGAETLRGCQGWTTADARVVTDGYRDASGFMIREYVRGPPGDPAGPDGVNSTQP